MIPIGTYCFHSVVDILDRGKSEVEFVSLGKQLVAQATLMEGDLWLEGRCFYLAARAYREAEFKRVADGSARDYKEEVISALGQASEREHLKAMQWLEVCYADGQSLMEPSPPKALAMKDTITRFIKRVWKYYDAHWNAYLPKQGFKMRDSVWFLEGAQGSPLITLEKRIYNHDLTMTVSAGKSWVGGGYHSAQIMPLIEDPQDAERYSAAIRDLQRWTHREAKVRQMFDVMDRWVMPYLLEPERRWPH